MAAWSVAVGFNPARVRKLGDPPPGRPAQHRAVAGHMLAERRVHDLGVARQQGVHHRNADTAAEVTGETEDRRTFVTECRGQGGESGGRERYEDEAGPHPCERPDHTTMAESICRSNPVICHVETAVNAKPVTMIRRLSTLLMMRPTTKNAI